MTLKQDEGWNVAQFQESVSMTFSDKESLKQQVQIAQAELAAWEASRGRAREAASEPCVAERLRVQLVELVASHKVLSFGEFQVDQFNGETFIELDVYIPRADWLQDGGLDVMSSLTELEQEGYILTPRIYPASEERAI
ncbi:hypothetical protein ACINK0_18055 (plasmid) [Deinococcus sp. VB343]|uniref:Uncharacterized protein n=1 Tax=Deinococcus sp. VB142 TaxID=3112952 RepID=A0AAU6Q8P9_9DEIO